MLDAKEFRIGNAVNFKNEIKILTLDDFRNISSTDYAPLLINDERMYRLGFIDEYHEIWSHVTLDFSFVVEDDGYYQYIGDVDGKIGRPIIYVHDLQNRFYSLTGIELIMADEESDEEE